MCVCFGYHFFGKDITTFYLPLKSPENRMAAFANERPVQITAVEKYFQRPRELERMGILSFFSQYDVIATSLSNRMIEINDERPHRLRPPNTLVKGSHWEEINFRQPNLIEKGYLFPSEQLPDAKSLIYKRRSTPQIVISERFSCSSNMEDFYYTYLLLSGSWRSDEEMKTNKDSCAKALEFHGISIPDDDQLLHYYKLLIKYMIASPRYNDYEITRYISLMNYDMKPYLRSLKDDYDINIQNRIDSIVNQIEIIDNAWSSDYIPSILDPPNSYIINQYINYKFTDAQIQEANDCLLNNINSLNREQHYIYDKIISRLENLQQVCAFIQGKAGTGKSFLINTLIKFLISKSIPYIVCASTGIAASLIGGSTVHSAFGIYSKKEQDIETILCSIDVSKPNGYAISFASVIIIDETTMISANILNSIDKGLKKIMSQKSDANYDKPFGGKNILLFDDLAQVPAVTLVPDDYIELIGQFHQSSVCSSFIKWELRTIMKQSPE